MLEKFTKDYHSPQEFEAICVDLAPKLQFSFGLNKVGILMGIGGIETDFAKKNRPRFEPAYAPGGKYFKAAHMQGLWDTYGDWACMSYGPWQIMAVKALELGYSGPVGDLWDGRISGPYVVMFLNNIFTSGAQKIEDVLDAYNTGNYRDANVPKDYIQKFWGCYGRVAERLLEKQEEEKNV